MLREELQLLQEPGSYVGEVVKVMGKTKVLVKVSMYISNYVKLCIHFVQLDRRLVSVDLGREEQHGGREWTETLTCLHWEFSMNDPLFNYLSLHFTHW